MTYSELSSNVSCFAVGHRIPGWRPGLTGEGVCFSATPNGISLTFLFASPTSKEVKYFRSRNLGVGLVPAGKHTLFVVQDPAGRWTDAPSSLGKNPPNLRALPERLLGSAEGFLLHAVLADPLTGIIHAQKAVGMSGRMSDALHLLVEEQRGNLGQWSEAAHQMELNAAYSRWPTPEMIVAKSPLVERAGKPVKP